MIRLAGSLLALSFACLVAACAQGEGERCERNQDCKADLTCMKAANEPSGRCTSGNGTPNPTPNPTPDAAAIDQAAPAPDTAPSVDTPLAAPDGASDTAAAG